MCSNVVKVFLMRLFETSHCCAIGLIDLHSVTIVLPKKREDCSRVTSTSVCKRLMILWTLIVGDIIHLIGYYPNNRPTTTTARPSFDQNNKPYYQYPYNQQNDWNYETNQIQHGPGSSSSYPTYHSPVSPTHNTQNSQKPQNNYNYNNNNNNYGNGYLDDNGYQVTPSPVVSNNDVYNRPQSTPSRPQSTINGYQSPDYDEGFNYGSYQGRETI